MTLLSHSRHLLLIAAIATSFCLIEYFVIGRKVGELDGAHTGARVGIESCDQVEYYLPRLVISGTMKSGSRALMELLQGKSAKKSISWWNWISTEAPAAGRPKFVSGSGLKPRLASASAMRDAPSEITREVHYFGLDYELAGMLNSSVPAGASAGSGCDSEADRRRQAYASHFIAGAPPPPAATASRAVFFDKSPDYIRSVRKLWQIRELVPAARHVLLLRDGVDRLYSEFQHHCRHGRYVLVPASAIEGSGLRAARVPLLHGEVATYVRQQLGWTGCAWRELRPAERFRDADVLVSPGTPALFHAYVTRTPVEHRGQPHLVRKILGFRDIEELLLRMYFSGSGPEALAPRLPAQTIRQRQHEVLQQWQTLLAGRSGLNSLFAFPDQLERREAKRLGLEAQVRQWVLLVGPENDLAHSNYSSQLEALFATAAREEDGGSGAGDALRRRVLVLGQADLYARTARGAADEVRQEVELLLAGHDDGPRAAPALSPTEVVRRYSLLSATSPAPPTAKYAAMLPETRHLLCKYFAADNNRTMALLQHYHS